MIEVESVDQKLVKNFQRRARKLAGVMPESRRRFELGNHMTATVEVRGRGKKQTTVFSVCHDFPVFMDRKTGNMHFLVEGVTVKGSQAFRFAQHDIIRPRKSDVDIEESLEDNGISAEEKTGQLYQDLSRITKKDRIGRTRSRYIRIKSSLLARPHRR